LGGVWLALTQRRQLLLPRPAAGAGLGAATPTVQEPVNDHL
jgi:hypothetical protein